MSDEWTRTTLGEVVEVNPEGVREMSDSEQFRYIDIASVSADRGVMIDSLETYSLADAPGRAKRRVREDDVLVSTVRPYLRAFAKVPKALEGEVCSTGFGVLRATSATVPGFVWAVVTSDAFVADLMSKATGSNYPAVRPGDIASVPIHLPPLAEQRRIAGVVEALDRQIEALRTELDALRALRAAVTSALLSREIEIPESFDETIGLEGVA